MPPLAADNAAPASHPAGLFCERSIPPLRHQPSEPLEVFLYRSVAALIGDQRSARPPQYNAIRAYANGCESQPVPFLEGIWVNAQFRRQGIGAGLIKHIEAFLLARGFWELGSDTPIDNDSSQAAHLGWEFSETERVIYFRKTLKPFGR